MQTSKPEKLKLYFARNSMSKEPTVFTNIHTVEWHQFIIRIRLRDTNSVTYPYTELRKIEEFDDNPRICK